MADDSNNKAEISKLNTEILNMRRSLDEKNESSNALIAQTIMLQERVIDLERINHENERNAATSIARQRDLEESLAEARYNFEATLAQRSD
ncbi:MAG: hypothetical protein ACK55I_31465, partial [bacterium]